MLKFNFWKQEMEETKTKEEEKGRRKCLEKEIENQ